MGLTGENPGNAINSPTTSVLRPDQLIGELMDNLILGRL